MLDKESRNTWILASAGMADPASSIMNLLYINVVFTVFLIYAQKLMPCPLTPIGHIQPYPLVVADYFENFADLQLLYLGGRFYDGGRAVNTDTV
ncbi:MAG: hypothetical protein Q7R50_07025 [Dehalococcoidales bacterium]|nr:hypothetical protein [Dehalococcoidales bacterium]